MKRWRRRVSAPTDQDVTWKKPPAAGAADSVRMDARPLPGQPVRPRPWMTADYYDGYVIVRDHLRRKQFRFTFPTGGDIADGIIRDLRNGQG